MHAEDVSPPADTATMTKAVEYADLSTEGLLYVPRLPAGGEGFGGFSGGVVEYLDTDRDAPEIAGMIPNLEAFARGGDHNVGAFEIKAQGTDEIVLPRNLDFLLPTTALIADDLYAAAGTRAARESQVSLQFFRRDYAKGERLLFDQVHRHLTEGKMVIYVATAIDVIEGGDPHILGTEYYAERVIGQKIARAERARDPDDFRARFAERGIVAAPGGAIVRFGETTLHAAPDITAATREARAGFAGRAAVRRSLINIIASFKGEDGLVYGRTRAPNDHRASPCASSVA